MKWIVEKLGLDQWKWISEHHSINLTHWRMEYIQKWSKWPDWYYVGDWQPNDPVLDAYDEREKNLNRDKYHYWPMTTPRVFKNIS